MFSWISRRKPSKATTEDKGRCSSSSSSGNNEFTEKFNMVNNYSYHNTEEAMASQRHDIVKIFVNYEEYGLLAIGTLGYDPSGVVEPEFELFEIRPGALEEVRQEQQQRNKKKKSRGHRTYDNQTDDNSKEQELVLASKLVAKVFPLETLTHIPLSARFLKGSRLVDRLLRPLSYLGSRSRRSSSSNLVPRKSEETFGSSLFEKLVKRARGINHGGSEDRRYAGSSKAELQIMSNVDDLASSSSKKTKQKKKEEDGKTKTTTITRLLQFPCASATSADNAEDEEDEDEDKQDKEESDGSDGGGRDKVNKQTKSRTEEEKDYKIHTESEFVVLEL